jgi:D-alanyl-lipoteichoic acid acyltransferase DltB (MBOAT superfamily)
LVAATLAITFALIRTDVVAKWWIVNHLVLIAGFIVVMQAAGHLAWSLWKLMGFRSRPFADNIILSRTPAEFWRRWSWPMHLWLYRYIYVPVGGRRRKLAVLSVFLVNGVFHEIIFGAAIHRITGHQMVFFLLSALGVLASPTLERLEHYGTAGVALMRLITITFLAATAVFMFVSYNYIQQIYGRPTWLVW